MNSDDTPSIPHNMLYVKHHNGVLSFRSTIIWQCRGINSEKLILDTITKHNITQDFEFSLATSDRGNSQLPENLFKEADLSFTTDCGNYDKVFPSFIYVGWPECGIESYTETCDRLAQITNSPLKKNTLGWIGVLNTHPNRQVFNEISESSKNIECIEMEWTEEGKKSFLSMEEQIKRWDFLIDIEGWGFSARLPILMHSNRVVFIQDRPFEEWWYQYLKPWETHVPVKRDFSDLEENLNRLISDKELQRRILKGQRGFADKYLTYDAQLDRIAGIIKGTQI